MLYLSVKMNFGISKCPFFFWKLIVDTCVYKRHILAINIKLSLFANNACQSYQNCDIDIANAVVKMEMKKTC